MQLYLLRHAIAVDPGAPGIDHDADRYLSDEGVARMRQATAGMRRLELTFDRVVSSPYVRAWQTAEIAAAACAPGVELETAESLRANRNPTGFLAELRAGNWDGKSVLAVGHEPCLSQLMGLLLKSPALSVDFKKAALCQLTLFGQRPAINATLDWFLAPRQLRLLGKSSD